MNSIEYKKFVKAHVMKAFARVGKNDQDNIGRMQILIDDIVERKIPKELVSEAFTAHAEKSQFAPTLSDIMQFLNAPKAQDEFEFIERFRSQAASTFWFTEMDDDVYTVKKHIGNRRVEQATTSEWGWIEKQAINIWRLLKNKELEIQANPHTIRVKVLPEGSRMLPKNSLALVSDSEAILLKELLPGISGN